MNGSHGVNAVEYASAIIAFLQDMARRFRNEGRFDVDCDVPHTTIHVGLVRGGTALNIVPAECFFEVLWIGFARSPESA